MVHERVYPDLKKGDRIRPLKGLSGVDVFLIQKKSGTSFVRKQSPTLEGNIRLNKQLDKQKWFMQRGEDSKVLTPEILGEGEIGGRLYFDMERIVGLDGVSFLQRASYQEVEAFGRFISEYLRWASEEESLFPPRTSFSESLHTKIDAVEEKCPWTLSYCDALRAKIALIEGHDLDAAWCHGDLTFENMMIDSSGRVVFLDFLDNYHEHPMPDVSKLFQDLRGLWYSRHGKVVSASVRGFLVQRFMKVAAELVGPSVDAALLTELLLALTFLRIAPYATSVRDIDIVRTRLESFT